MPNQTVAVNTGRDRLLLAAVWAEIDPRAPPPAIASLTLGNYLARMATFAALVGLLVMLVGAIGIGYPSGLWWFLVLLARFITTFEQPRAFWTLHSVDAPAQNPARGRRFTFLGLLAATMGAGLAWLAMNTLQGAGVLLSLGDAREGFWMAAYVLWTALYLRSTLARTQSRVRSAG